MIVECLYDIWNTGRFCSHKECLEFRGYDGKSKAIEKWENKPTMMAKPE